MKNLDKPHARILIIGAGDHGQVVADCLWQRKQLGDLVELIGYLDDDPALSHKQFLNIPVLGTIAQRHQFEYDAAIVAIGNNSIRAKIFLELQSEQAELINVIHPSAILGSEVTLGHGIMIMAGVVINTGTIIGNNVILNTSCSVDHHGHISNHVHIAPGVHLGGHVAIGEGSLAGIGSTVIPGKNIGAWSSIGAGGCVVTDIPAHTTAIGVPAKPIKI